MQYSELQINSQFESILGNKEFYQVELTDTLKNTAFGDSDLYTYLSGIKSFSGVSDLKSLLTWSYQNAEGETEEASKKIQEVVSEAIGATELVSDVQKEALKSVIAFQQTLLEKQINNLEAQKSTLGEINKQREYENKLIEAKLKLENAQKDKKRI